ncbi:hypothetical protein D3C80_431580 [compost metagenome]
MSWIIECGAIRILISPEVGPGEVKIDPFLFAALAVGGHTQRIFRKFQPVVADGDLHRIGCRRMARLENPFAVPFDADIEHDDDNEEDSGNDGDAAHQRR